MAIEPLPESLDCLQKLRRGQTQLCLRITGMRGKVLL